MLTTYVLVMEKASTSRVRIGKTTIFMKEGFYLYVGSAKKGLEQRLARHVKKRKKRFWHIDYVTCRRDVTVRSIYLSPHSECETLSLVSSLGTLLGHKLGSSDCTCPSHFVKLNSLDVNIPETQLAKTDFVEFSRVYRPSPLMSGRTS